MAYWLLKTEPDCYSWDDLVRDRSTTWDGVSNALALKHIRSMKKGDLVLVYHTGGQRQAGGGGRGRRGEGRPPPPPPRRATRNSPSSTCGRRRSSPAPSPCRSSRP